MKNEGIVEVRRVTGGRCGAGWRGLALVALSAVGAGLASGCGAIFGGPFAPGTYAADVPCTLSVVAASGETGTEEFTSPTTLTVDADGQLSVNGVELAVGEQVVRSIPTADLAFEITEVTRRGCLVTVVYEPRPTLPGISIEGELVETYRWRWGSILASAQGDLVVNDVSGANTFTVDCEATLESQ